MIVFNFIDQKLRESPRKRGALKIEAFWIRAVRTLPACTWIRLKPTIIINQEDFSMRLPHSQVLTIYFLMKSRALGPFANRHKKISSHERRMGSPTF